MGDLLAIHTWLDILVSGLSRFVLSWACCLAEQDTEHQLKTEECKSWLSSLPRHDARSQSQTCVAGLLLRHAGTHPERRASPLMLQLIGWPSCRSSQTLATHVLLGFWHLVGAALWSAGVGSSLQALRLFHPFCAAQISSRFWACDRLVSCSLGQSRPV